MKGFSLASIESVFRTLPAQAAKYIHASAAYRPSPNEAIDAIIATFGKCFLSIKHAVEFLQNPTQLINAPTWAPIIAKWASQKMLIAACMPSIVLPFLNW